MQTIDGEPITGIGRSTLEQKLLDANVILSQTRAHCRQLLEELRVWRGGELAPLARAIGYARASEERQAEIDAQVRILAIHRVKGDSSERAPISEREALLAIGVAAHRAYYRKDVDL